MNKTELISIVAEKAELTKNDTEKALEAFQEVVVETLAKKEEVKLVGFGTFSVVERAERAGVNPQTKEAITIPASTVPKLKFAKSIKELVNSK